MKIIIFFTLFFYCFLGLHSQNQGEIEYTISFNKPTNEQINNLNAENRNALLKIFKNSKDVTAVLLFSKNKSVYKLEDVLENEAIGKHSITKSRSGGKDVYFYNIKSNERLLQKNFMGNLFLIPERAIEWEITQETKEIGNYICYKAIDVNSTNKKEKPVAWFTLQIPIGFCPKNL